MKKSLLIFALSVLALLTLTVQPVSACVKFTKEVAGPTLISIYTYYEWTITIQIQAWGYDLTGVVVADKFPAEVAVKPSSVNPSIGSVTVEKYGKGKKGATWIMWNIGDMADDQEETLTFTVYTVASPSGRWVGFTTPGTYVINYGANVTYTIVELSWTETEGPVGIFTVIAS